MPDKRTEKFLREVETAIRTDHEIKFPAPVKQPSCMKILDKKVK